MEAGSQDDVLQAIQADRLQIFVGKVHLEVALHPSKHPNEAISVHSLDFFRHYFFPIRRHILAVNGPY